MLKSYNLFMRLYATDLILALLISLRFAKFKNSRLFLFSNYFTFLMNLYLSTSFYGFSPFLSSWIPLSLSHSDIMALSLILLQALSSRLMMDF